MNSNRLFISFSGLFGAAGVALAAAASHTGAANVATAADFLLIHAPALLALGLFLPAAGRVLLAAGWILIAGVVLFAGDLLARHYLGDRLFPMAAPAGGSLMIAGWLVVAIGGALRR